MMINNINHLYNEGENQYFACNLVVLYMLVIVYAFSFFLLYARVSGKKALC
jgi:hypothetical protein